MITTSLYVFICICKYIHYGVHPFPLLLGVVEPPTKFSKVGGGLIGRQFLDRFNGKEGVTFSGGGLHFYIKKTKI